MARADGYATSPLSWLLRFVPGRWVVLVHPLKVETRVRTPLGLLIEHSPVSGASLCKSLAVSYQEVVHAQAICEGLPALSL
jgi:hypothetical protein